MTECYLTTTSSNSYRLFVAIIQELPSPGLLKVRMPVVDCLASNRTSFSARSLDNIEDDMATGIEDGEPFLPIRNFYAHMDDEDGT